MNYAIYGALKRRGVLVVLGIEPSNNRMVSSI